MGWCKKNVTPLLTHWSYVFLALIISDYWLRYLFWNCPQLNVTGGHWWKVNIWFRQWGNAIRQQATTWTSVDPELCCHMTSLGYNELNNMSNKYRICHEIKCDAPQMIFKMVIKLRPRLFLTLNKMAVISQTIFSAAFLWMKKFVFWLQFHWNLFLRSNWQ